MALNASSRGQNKTFTSPDKVLVCCTKYKTSKKPCKDNYIFSSKLKIHRLSIVFQIFLVFTLITITITAVIQCSSIKERRPRSDFLAEIADDVEDELLR